MEGVRTVDFLGTTMILGALDLAADDHRVARVADAYRRGTGDDLGESTQK